MLAIKDVNLLDGKSQVPMKRTVLVDGERIREVAENACIPTGASIIEGAGLYATPGFIDAHTHFGGSDSFDRKGASTRFETYDYAQAREQFLRWGVTCVRTCGDLCPDILDFRDDANAGKLVSPRIVAVGPFIQGIKGHPAYTVYMSDKRVIENATIELGNDDDVEGAVQTVADMGADWIKIFYAHANKMNFPGHDAPRMPYSVVERVVRKAHGLGLKVVCHVDGPEEIDDLVRAGVDTIEHLFNVGDEEDYASDEVVRHVSESGIPMDVTLVATYKHADLMKDTCPDVTDKAKNLAKRLRKAGVHLMLGCDSGIPLVPFGESLHDEMSNFVEIGYSPVEAINLATAGNARGLGLDADLGSIEVGKYADIVLLACNPADDIAHTRDIRMVIKGGEIVYDATVSLDFLMRDTTHVCTR